MSRLQLRESLCRKLMKLIDEYLERSGLLPCPSGTELRDRFSSDIAAALAQDDTRVNVRKTLHGSMDPQPPSEFAYSVHVNGTSMHLMRGEYFDNRWHMQSMGDWAKIPDLENAATSGEYFNAIAERLAPFLTKPYRLGVAISLPLETGPDGRTVIAHARPELPVSAVLEGLCPEEELTAALTRSGASSSGTVRVIGEAAAVLFAGRALPPTAPENTISLFMDSGGQVAYFESGAGTSCQTVVTVIADKYADLTHGRHSEHGSLTNEPSAALGQYVLKEAHIAAREGYFTSPAARRIRSKRTLSTHALCSWLQSLPADPTVDEQVMECITLNMIHRVGQRMGACVSSAIRRLMGKKSHKNLFLVVDGTVFSAFRALRDNLNDEIAALQKGSDAPCWLAQVDRSVLVGAAYAALDNGPSL